jgi:hypothetical protein
MRTFILVVLLVVNAAALPAQTKRAPARKPAPPPPPPPPVTEPAVLQCPSLLGVGVKTARSFCDVLTGRDPAEGIVIAIPPHTGPVTLTVDLHNRHTYSVELVKTNRGYRRYTATIGALTADNTLLSRAIVQSDFRTEADLLDRVGGGAGPGGVKAVAPTGLETITLTIPEEENSVSLLGEKLSVIRPDAEAPDNFTALGRPIALISNATIEYRPPPPPRRTPPARRR